MRLRNKKTGEIKDVESLGHEKSLRDKYGPQITLSWNTEYENLGECRTYNSLAELNEDWEDYEEPKDFWYIGDLMIIWGTEGEFTTPDLASFTKKDIEKLKAIGNYFETREEAEKAVEKLKAWKRLKDKGFEFKTWGWEKRSGKEFTIWFTIDDYENSTKDLDLLFGGEE